MKKKIEKAWELATRISEIMGPLRLKIQVSKIDPDRGQNTPEVLYQGTRWIGGQTKSENLFLERVTVPMGKNATSIAVETGKLSLSQTICSLIAIFLKKGKIAILPTENGTLQIASMLTPIQIARKIQKLIKPTQYLQTENRITIGGNPSTIIEISPTNTT